MKCWLIFTFTDGQFVHCEANGRSIIYPPPNDEEKIEIEEANSISQMFGYTIEVKEIDEEKLKDACTMQDGENAGMVEIVYLLPDCYGIRIRYPELLAAESTSLV